MLLMYFLFLDLHETQNRATTTTTEHHCLDRIRHPPSTTGVKWRHLGKGIVLLPADPMWDVNALPPVVLLVLQGTRRRRITMTRLK